MDLRSRIALFWGFLAVAQAQVNIRWEVPESTWGKKDRGSSVTLKCMTSGERALTDIVTLRKSSPMTDSDYETVVTNQIVEDHLRLRTTSTGERSYDAHFVVGGGESTLVVTINELQPEDEGEYFCNLQSFNRAAITTEKRKILVNVPVMSVSMARVLENGTLELLPDTTTVSMVENTFGGVACVVALQSYYLTPEVTVTRPQSSDVSFTNTSFPVRREGTDTSPVYEHVFKYATNKPSYLLNGQTVTCEAFTENFENQKKSSSVQVTVEYQPVIRCDNTSLLAVEGGTSRVTCYIWSNPELSTLVVQFGMPVTDNTFNIDFGTITIEKYTFKREVSDDKTTLTFITDGVPAVFFGDYTFRIKATSSNPQFPVTLHDFHFVPGTIGGAVGLRLATTTIAILIIAFMETYIQLQ